jgi:hypothetical protein
MDTEQTYVEMELDYSPFGDLITPPSEMHFGETTEESILQDIQISLGNVLRARDIRKLYKLGHKELPTDLQVFGGNDIWLITHTVSAIKRRGTGKILSLGYEIEFKDPEEAYTIDLFPRTKFISSLDSSMENQVDVGIEGNVSLSNQAVDIGDKVESLGGSAKLKISSTLKMVGRVSFSVMSPVVTAIGIGSSRGEWLFEEHDKPLLGEQTMLQTVLVPRGTKSIPVRIRAYAHLKANWIAFPATAYTKWLDTDCKVL